MKKYSNTFEEFESKRILIVGEISAMKCKDFVETNNGEIACASAALIAMYANDLKANVTLVGTVGPDDAGSKIISKLQEKNIKIEGITIDPLKPTLCWNKVYQGKENSHLNMVTEQQVLDAALKKALSVRAILYVCQNPASFSKHIFEELKKVSEGLRIPFVVFGHPEFSPTNTTKNDLFILSQNNGSRISSEFCKKINANQCLAINSSNEFDLINTKEIEHHKDDTNIAVFKYEAALAAIAILLISCHKYPEKFTNLLKQINVDENNCLSVA